MTSHSPSNDKTSPIADKPKKKTTPQKEIVSRYRYRIPSQDKRKLNETPAKTSKFKTTGTTTSETGDHLTSERKIKLPGPGASSPGKLSSRSVGPTKPNASNDRVTFSAIRKQRNKGCKDVSESIIRIPGKRPFYKS